ncbi:hypothetical protein [Vulcanococcus sp.]|uniref:hypothetical protein n=1 Tax=Vulcanococcus sp. TaxID=2856995 RepID=UPI003C047375
MSNIIRIKRRSAGGAAGAPASLYQAELAYNESDPDSGVLYIGVGTGGANGTASAVVPIAGSGAYVNLTGNQLISGGKTFTGSLGLADATIDEINTTGNVTVGGNLTVIGDVTSVSSLTLEVEDKNIELGKVANPTNITADGGGISLLGDSTKTFNWIAATSAWTSSEHIDLATGKSYHIGANNVLSATTLGSGVVNSSLTKVGVLQTGTWQASTVATQFGGTGQTSYTDGQLLVGSSNNNSLVKATLSTGVGISVTNGPGTITVAGTYSTGDGLDLNGDIFSVDLKASGGLVIESGEIAVNLSATAITGTLAVSDGGTGATTASTARLNLGVAIGSDVQAWDAQLDTLSTMGAGAASALAVLTQSEVEILDGATVTTGELNIIDGSTTATATTLALPDRLVVNDGGTMVQVALSDLVTFLENGEASGFDLDGGVF